MNETTQLTEKRTRQARRLLRVCLRELWTECLVEYVRAFEGGTLRHDDARVCAVGTMARGCGKDYGGIAQTEHARAVNHIENIFEGYGLFLFTRLGWREWLQWPQWCPLSDSTRRLLIYEACVEELARRNVEATPKPEPVAVGVCHV